MPADYADGRGDLGDYLRSITANSAAALRCWADGEPYPCPLPLTDPLAAPATGAPGESTDWTVRALARIKCEDKPLRELELTAELLAPGPRRAFDGLPAWSSHAEPAWTALWQPSGPQRQGQRNGRVRRDILAAVSADIHERPLAWVSGEVLGLSDHEEFFAGERIAKTPSGAKRYRRRGRAILAALGAWPWAVADSGRLEPDWREQRRYAFALDCWRARAADELRAELTRVS